MSIDEKTQDQKHLVNVNLFETALPTAEKPCIARVQHKDAMDLRSLAAKTALMYQGVSEEIIYLAAVQLFEAAKYCIADGYTINTDFVRASISIPGVYDLHDRHIAEGKQPGINITAAPQLRDYIADKVKLHFEGVNPIEGYIEQMIDALSGTTNDEATPNGAMTVLGYGLKVMDDGTPEHVARAGAWLESVLGDRLRAKVIVNEPKRLVLSLPGNLQPGTLWWLEIVSQANPNHSSSLMKEMLVTRSEVQLRVKN
ncbi:hypothetical protein Barb6XT_01450 [Bacteroidales bacterium Barb6XT]|nr:hypothetical protein Barb6XT_01450 [Bacteroidales bacterium Barb6XT]